MSKLAILLINLGSPSSTNPDDVKVYLDEFLMDEFVIDLPYLVRYLLVKGIILNTRPKKSAEAYASIWWDEGSPLIVLSERFQSKFQQKTPLPVGLAMRYAQPSIQQGIQSLLDDNPSIEHIVAVPLYPHYAMATTRTVVDKTNDVIRDHFSHLTVDFVPPFYQHPAYISALSASIGSHLNKSIDYLLFSYHGIPVRHLKKTDPTKRHCYKVPNCCEVPCDEAHDVCYRHQLVQTTQLVANQLRLDPKQYSISFQSRLGLDEWLKPPTDKEIERLAKEGIKHLAVCCPAFVADCLETLEEMGEEGKEIFLEHGGESFTLIPCLNDDDQWVDALHDIVNEIL